MIARIVSSFAFLSIAPSSSPTSISPSIIAALVEEGFGDAPAMEARLSFSPAARRFPTVAPLWMREKRRSGGNCGIARVWLRATPDPPARHVGSPPRVRRTRSRPPSLGQTFPATAAASPTAPPRVSLQTAPTPAPQPAGPPGLPGGRARRGFLLPRLRLLMFVEQRHGLPQQRRICASRSSLRPAFCGS